MPYRDFGQNFGNTGKAAMIPAAMGTIGGIQAIQSKQNDMAMQEMKMEEAKKKEAFENEPMSVDYVITQTGFKPGTKAHDFMKGQVESVAENGWTTRGKLKQLKEYLKGSEENTYGLLNAQIEDADSQYMELQAKVMKAKENTAENQDYASQQKVKQMEDQLRSYDLSRKALRDKLNGTQEAFKAYHQYEKKQMEEEQKTLRQREKGTADMTRAEMVELIRQATAAMKEREATKRKGIRPSGVAQRYRITIPGQAPFTQSLAEGEDISPKQYPEGTKIEKIGEEKKAAKATADWKSQTGGTTPATNQTKSKGTTLW